MMKFKIGNVNLVYYLVLRLLIPAIWHIKRMILAKILKRGHLNTKEISYKVIIQWWNLVENLIIIKVAILLLTHNLIAIMIMTQFYHLIMIVNCIVVEQMILLSLTIQLYQSQREANNQSQASEMKLRNFTIILTL